MTETAILTRNFWLRLRQFQVKLTGLSKLLAHIMENSSDNSPGAQHRSWKLKLFIPLSWFCFSIYKTRVSLTCQAGWLCLKDAIATWHLPVLAVYPPNPMSSRTYSFCLCYSSGKRPDNGSQWITWVIFLNMNMNYGQGNSVLPFLALVSCLHWKTMVVSQHGLRPLESWFSREIQILSPEIEKLGIGKEKQQLFSVKWNS